MRRVTAAIAGAASAALVAVGPAYAGSAPLATTPVPTVATSDCAAMGDMAGMDHDAMGHDAMGHDAMAGHGHSMATAACDARSEYDFLVHMIPHHAEAVAAAKELKRSQRAELRKVGKAIVTAQTAEIKQMRAWLKAWSPGKSTKVAYEPMMPDLADLTGDALDKAFIDGMIGHHAHAVAMAQHIIKHKLVVHEPFGPFVENIRDVQKVEIKQMRQWKKDWFGKKG
jgi:uncharacterized protein (DUF305 family)